VRITPPTQFILSKLFLQTRYRYDMADIVHVMLRKHDQIDWQWLLNQLELYWEVLLINILNFRFVYPSERHLIPHWADGGAVRAAEGAGGDAGLVREDLPRPAGEPDRLRGGRQRMGFRRRGWERIDEKHERPSH
jgi:hypothetical protein